MKRLKRVHLDNGKLMVAGRSRGNTDQQPHSVGHLVDSQLLVEQINAMLDEAKAVAASCHTILSYLQKRDIIMMSAEQLDKATIAYYQGNPTMTDAEFDDVVSKLKKEEPDHPFLKRIGAPVPGKQKAKHKIPMGSLNNANNEEEFLNWLPEGLDICLSHKLDGSSVELVYVDGSFIQAITRGNGDEGEDVTQNVLKSGNIPLSLDESITSVRCECLIHIDDWQKHFEGDANPRNSAAGTLRRHDGHNAQYLRFYAFDALVDNDRANKFMRKDARTEEGILDILRDGFKVPSNICMSARRANCLETISRTKLISWCKIEEVHRDELPYEIDGIVAKVNHRGKSKNLGIRNGRPKGQIAFKFKPRGGETILRKVTWHVGHTGALTPVGEVDPVGVGGTVIRSVTLCNMDEIQRLGIAIGDTVEIIRAGDVIPKLSKLKKEADCRHEISPPTKCPECGGSVTQNGARLFCGNDQCPARLSSQVMTWIKKRNILNLGVGLVSASDIESIYGLYVMKLEDWSNIEVGNGRFGEKRATKVMKVLEKSKSVSLSDFIGSIGITGVGRSLAAELCNGLKLRTLKDIFALTPSQIAEQEKFGVVRADDFWCWLRKYRKEIMELANIMNFKDEVNKDDGNGVFDGEVLCFTGKSPKPRTEMQSLAQSAGGSISSSVSSKTTILVIADVDSTSSKAVKARELGVKLMSPDDFLSQV